MKMKTILKIGLILITFGSITSCEKMLDMNSNLVMFTDDILLDEPADTVYTVMGILSKLQVIADRTVLLGELRGDLTELSPQASVDLKQLADFSAGTDNKYNAPEDYYAVINSCNFYLAKADTSLKINNLPVFLKEYAAVKTIRAWTYLQLVLVYGKVPFVTKPILSEADAQKAYPEVGLDSICSYFISDIQAYINTEMPNYGAISNLDSRKFFIPVRVLLGDLCLWSGRYLEAANYYHDFITLENNEMPLGTSQIFWYNESTTFELILDLYSYQFYNVSSNEIISYIPMEQDAAKGTFSDLKNVFNSTVDNNYYYQAAPSKKMTELSLSQTNCIVYDNGTRRDTLFAPETNEENPFWVGDLRLSSVYRKQTATTTTGSIYSSERQTISKINNQHVIVYRRAQIYLRFAEALNRAGFPESAFVLLKYGLNSSNIVKYVSASERSRAGNLLEFSLFAFNEENTIGMHSRGSGESSANKYYIIPTLPSQSDTIDYVEEMICNENALETSFEGNRFFDLMRMALHRGDIDFLAKKVAERKGALNYDATLYGTLTDQKSWYLPLK